MTRSDDNILSLPPLTPDFGFGPDFTQITPRDSSNVVADLQAINDHTWRQKLQIDSAASRTRHGIRRALELDQYGASMFHETVEGIMKINEAGQGSRSEVYDTAFNDRLLKTAARHVYGLLEVGVGSIAQQVMCPVPPPHQPEPKSFWDRVFG
jgi:hypothetical protein